MTRKIFMILLAITLALSIGIMGCTTPAQQEEEEEEEEEPEVITLIFETPYSTVHPMGIADQRWMDKIEEETDGRVQFEPYFGGVLLSTQEMWQGLIAGVADVGQATGAYEQVGFDLYKLAIGNFFYGIDDFAVGRQISLQIMDEFPEIEAEYDELKMLAVSSVTPYQLFTVDPYPVYTLDDLSGMQIRAISFYFPLLSELGAEGMSIPMPDTYVALQKKTVDGMLGPFETLESFKFGEVVDYITPMYLSRGFYPNRGMNWDVWNSLPADIQDIFEANIDFWGEAQDEELLKVEETAVQFALDEGAQLIELSAEDREYLNSVLAAKALEAAAELDAMGLPGTEIFERTRELIDEAYE